MRKEEKKEKIALYEIAQRAVIYDPSNQKFLLMKYTEDGKEDQAWSLVGGRMLENESSEGALKREVTEELGKTIDFNTVGVIDAYISRNTIRIANLVYYLSGEIQISEEHCKFAWLSKDEIEKEKLFHDGVKKFIYSAVKYMEAEKSLDSWKRCQADFENYKKSQVKHQEDFRKYAKMDVIEQILPILDNFEASLDHVPEKNKENKWVEGIVYIKKQIEDVLKNNDIEEILVEAGDKFDPEIHEAVGGDGKKQKIIKIIQKGYRLNGRILRAARVEVG
jgi:molecular chaperone GrpE